MRQLRSEEIHAFGGVVIGLAFTFVGGYIAAQGRPLPDWVSIGIGIVLGWFFRSATSSK